MDTLVGVSVGALCVITLGGFVTLPIIFSQLRLTNGRRH